MVEVGDRVVLFSSKDKHFIGESVTPEAGDTGMLINASDFKCFLPKTSVEVGDTSRIFTTKDKYFVRGKTYWCPKAIGYYTTEITEKEIDSDYNMRYAWRNRHRVNEKLLFLSGDSNKIVYGYEEDVFYPFRTFETYVNGNIIHPNNLYNHHNNNSWAYFNEDFQLLYQWDFGSISNYHAWIRFENWYQARVKIETSLDGETWETKLDYTFPEDASYDAEYLTGLNLGEFRYLKLSGGHYGLWIYYFDIIEDTNLEEKAANSLVTKNLISCTKTGEPLYILMYPLHPEITPNYLATLNSTILPEPTNYSFTSVRTFKSVSPDQEIEMWSGNMSLFKDEELHISFAGSGGLCYVEIDGNGEWHSYPYHVMKQYSEVKTISIITKIKGSSIVQNDADLIIWEEK